MRTFLHVAHSWGGGLAKWVDDFIKGDVSANRHFLFQPFGNSECYGEKYVLREGRSREVLESFELQSKIRDFEIDHEEHESLLREVESKYGITDLIISTFIGQSLAFLKLRSSKLVVMHDYFPFCPALNVYFKSICQRCNQEDLSVCLKENPLSNLFRWRSSSFWSEAREVYLSRLKESGAQVVVPDASLVSNLIRLDSRFRDFEMTVVPHGIGTPKVRSAADYGPLIEGHEAPRVLIPGRFAHRKGSELLREVVPGLVRSGIEIFAMGAWDTSFYEQFPEIKVVGDYSIDEMPELLRGYRPHVAIMPSIVPETFSYVLSEMQHFSVPVIVPRMGSFENRVTEDFGAFYDGTAQGLDRTLRGLLEDPLRLQAMSHHLDRMPARGLTEMYRDYENLLERRS